MTWTYHPTETRAPEATPDTQATSWEPGGDVRTFCWRRPAGPGARLCAARPRPWAALWGAPHAPPRCTPDTWRSHKTDSKSPSPVGDTRTMPGPRHWVRAYPHPAIYSSQPPQDVGSSVSKRLSFLFMGEKEKRKDKRFCARSQSGPDRTPKYKNNYSAKQKVMRRMAFTWNLYKFIGQCHPNKFN